jgi:glycosyltransferase involved in cell wall biosynthesis
MSAPKRILFTQKFASLGGSQVSLVHHLALLDRTRFEPFVAVSNTGWLTITLDLMQIRWVQLPFGHWTNPFAIPANIRLIARLRALIRAESIDLVHANEHFVGPQSLLAAKWAGVKAICHFRTGLDDLTPRRIKKYLYAKFDRVLPVAEVLRKRLAEHVDASKLTVVRDGVEENVAPERMSKNGSRTILMNVGAIYPVKGQALILERALPWLKANPRNYIVFVGGHRDGDAYAGAMKKVVRDNALERQVKFLGSRNDVPRLLTFANALIAYSTVEGIPRVVTEAMFAQKPVIVGNSAGMDEVVIDNEVGRILDMNDAANKVAPVLQDLTKNRAKWEAMGKRAAEIAVARYSTRAMSDQIQAVYAELLDGKKDA